MKHYTLVLALIVFAVFSSCQKDDEPVEVFRSKEYTLRPVGSSKVSGTVTFTEKKDGTTSVLVALNNSSTDVHPAFIYYNDEAKGGEVAVTLKSIDCSCQSSTTEVSKLATGIRLTYEDLLRFNGHVKVHLSDTKMETILVQGNIGSNVE
ncbi:hypothetical protein PP178_01895 [Zeaxanthinibacter sp. PT1]|uniref:hypothetical protein n=1 Tax=Zeaxanthinibacter TaxID=561554 RepID=UPI00234AC5A2|nr:hypothetical protein [Zeaxanthinibacter sp. PT1]MDC6350288.1 hypothetical protein [Zeaxanthinibacter sp. PT1]